MDFRLSGREREFLDKVRAVNRRATGGPGSACNWGAGFDARLRRGGMAEGVARRLPATA